jgi:hypothetical protein
LPRIGIVPQRQIGRRRLDLPAAVLVETGAAEKHPPPAPAMTRRSPQTRQIPVIVGTGFFRMDMLTGALRRQRRKTKIFGFLLCRRRSTQC